MKASELAADLIRMIAEHGDHEVAALPQFECGTTASPLEALSFYVPSILDQDDGALPCYLIRWWVGPTRKPVLVDFPCETEGVDRIRAEYP